MKVKVKSPFYDRNGLHKRNDIVEIETNAFNPITMAVVPEQRVKAIKETVEEATTTSDEPTKPVRRRKRKAE